MRLATRHVDVGLDPHAADRDPLAACAPARGCLRTRSGRGARSSRTAPPASTRTGTPGRASIRPSTLENVRAHLRIVSRFGHSHAESMCAWPTATRRCALARAGVASSGASSLRATAAVAATSWRSSASIARSTPRNTWSRRGSSSRSCRSSFTRMSRSIASASTSPRVSGDVGLPQAVERLLGRGRARPHRRGVRARERGVRPRPRRRARPDRRAARRAAAPPGGTGGCRGVRHRRPTPPPRPGSPRRSGRSRGSRPPRCGRRGRAPTPPARCRRNLNQVVPQGRAPQCEPIWNGE